MVSYHPIVIIGAGPGGICMGAKLREAGYRDFVILEREDGLGGTWRYNTYPGAACDIASHLYSFSFFPNPEWSRPYARQPEILAYIDRFAGEYGVKPHIRYGVTVAGARWDDAAAQWTIETNEGDFIADVMISAVGMFGKLNIPDIPGLDDFAGKVIHSARWDHDHDLTGSVAVVGNGATAIQVVPQIAPHAKRFYHFQRQPQWVGPKDDDVPFTDEQIAGFVGSPDATRALRNLILDRVDGAITYSDLEMLRAAEERGMKSLQLVTDPAKRAKLKPVGPYGCHRPLNSQAYYPTFNLPHVDIVNEGIARITPDAIVTVDGVERPVDTIVFCTGFDTTQFLRVIDVVGRDGLKLAEAWADGPQAYLGVTIAGFPNLFMIYGPNTNNGTILFMVEQQAVHVVQQLDRMKAEGLRTIEVRGDAMRDYNERVQHDIGQVKVWQGNCHGYYTTAEGRNVTQWPHGMREYAAWIDRSVPDAYDGERRERVSDDLPVAG